MVPYLTISEEEELKRTLDTRVMEEVGKVREDLRKDEEIERIKRELREKKDRWETQIRMIMSLVKEAMKTTKEALVNNNHQKRFSVATPRNLCFTSNYSKHV